MNTTPHGYPANRPSDPDLGAGDTVGGSAPSDPGFADATIAGYPANKPAGAPVGPATADAGFGTTGHDATPVDSAGMAAGFGSAHTAPPPSPLYTADGSQSGARKQPRSYSVTMLMLAAAVATAAVFGIIGTPGFVVGIVAISPVVLILALVALVATRNT